MQVPPVAKQSDKARADVKKSTAEANKTGAIPDTAARCCVLTQAGEKHVKDSKPPRRAPT